MIPDDPTKVAPELRPFSRLGELYEHNAELCAGALLILLAGIFAVERLV